MTDTRNMTLDALVKTLEKIEQRDCEVILLCLDAIENKGPGCTEMEILRALIAEREGEE